MTGGIPVHVRPIGSSDRADAAGEASPGATRYEIRVSGRLDERWSSWFDEFTIRTDPDGWTSIAGTVVDQSALHGVLTRVRDLGLELISVAQVVE